MYKKGMARLLVPFLAAAYASEIGSIAVCYSLRTPSGNFANFAEAACLAVLLVSWTGLVAAAFLIFRARNSITVFTCKTRLRPLMLGLYFTALQWAMEWVDGFYSRLRMPNNWPDDGQVVLFCSLVVVPIACGEALWRMSCGPLSRSPGFYVEP
jgi:hypothetical protein